jgi:HK97 gp10 family phage protein
MSFEIEIKGMAELLNKFSNAPQIIKGVKHDMLNAAAQIAVREAKENTPVNEGILRNSISYSISVDAEKATIGTNVKYAPYQESGVPAGKFKGFPPYKPGTALARWAKLKLGDEKLAFVVARAIKKNGLKAHPFMKPALDKVSSSMGQIKRIGYKLIDKLSFKF